MPLLTLGMGNAILCDDAVGLHILALLESRCSALGLTHSIDFLALQTGGMDLLYEIDGFDYLVVIDAYYASDSIPGRIRVLSEASFIAHNTVDSAHLFSLPTALRLSRELGYHTPKLIGAVMVDVGDNCTVFGETLSEAVKRSIPAAVDRAFDLIVHSPPIVGLIGDF